MRRMEGRLKIPLHDYSGGSELSVRFSQASMTGDTQEQRATLPCVLAPQKSLEIRYSSGESLGV